MKYQQAAKSAQKEQPKTSSSVLHQTSLNRIAVHPLLKLEQTIGNQAVQNMRRSGNVQIDPTTRAFIEPRFGHDFSRIPVSSSHSPVFQTKLKVNQPGDAYEQEADRVSEQVMRMADSEASAPEEEEQTGKSLMRKQNIEPQAKASTISSVPPIVGNVLNSGGGQPLDRTMRAFMEQRFGHDFSKVRVHTDERAAELSSMVRARAVTAGSDIFFGRCEYSPATVSGRQLIAHELTHVIQQPHVSIQRQEIPQELKVNVNLRLLSEEKLHERYDLITAALSQFDSSTADTVLLEKEAGDIGNELGRREALAAGRTFTPDAIEKMRQYFIKNTKKPKPSNCIDTMNEGLRLLYGDKEQSGGDSVDKTMAALQAANRAGQARVIEFEDEKGRVSKSGSLYPHKVHESVWDAVMQMAEGDVGWCVFGMGPADMSHSVTLTLDNNDPSNPVIYWSDQWPSKGGWKKYNKTGLDEAVAEVTQIIWEKKDEKHKPDTRVTLWRLRAEAKSPVGPHP